MASANNNSKAYSGQQGCVTIPARKCKTNVNKPDWAAGAKLVSKFLFNKDDINHLRRGSKWAEQMDPEQKYTSFRIIECEPLDTGKCNIKSEYSHIQFIDAGLDLEKGFALADNGELPQLKISLEILITFLKSFLALIVWLKEAHLSGFSHNDIKFNNICFDGEKVRLIDFSDRSHTVWGEILESKGSLGNIKFKFNNNEAKKKLQIEDINGINDLLLELLNTIMESYKLSLTYARALKIALHGYKEPDNNSNIASDIYIGINEKIQFFLKLLIAQLEKIGPDEFFAKEDINYFELKMGRQATPAEIAAALSKLQENIGKPATFQQKENAKKLLRQRLRDAAFMQTWSDADTYSYELAKADVMNRKGGTRKMRRSRLRRQSFRRRF